MIPKGAVYYKFNTHVLYFQYTGLHFANMESALGRCRRPAKNQFLVFFLQACADKKIQMQIRFLFRFSLALFRKRFQKCASEALYGVCGCIVSEKIFIEMLHASTGFIMHQFFFRASPIYALGRCRRPTKKRFSIISFSCACMASFWQCFLFHV